MVVAALLLGHPWRREAPAKPVVEILSLRFHGRESRVKVVDSAAAGSIAFAPEIVIPGVENMARRYGAGFAVGKGAYPVSST